MHTASRKLPERTMFTVNSTPFPELNAVLSEWLTSVQTALGDNFVAAYLQGSFAVGDFDGDSDVDFLVVIQEELSDAQLSELQSTHARIYDLPSPWAQHLEGSYFPLNALRHCDPSGAQPWYLDNTSKVLVRSSHDNTMVVRWVVRERGITLAGPDPQTLIDPVTAADLRREMQRTMRDWAEEIRSGRSPLDNCWVQTFAVLIYCRMLHTLHTGRIGSKLAGARWAKEALDGQWAGLIDRAWDERPNPSLKVRQPADRDDLKRTSDFIKYALGFPLEVGGE